MKVRYLLDGKTGVGPSRLIYLQLQVFHKQSPDCSAQGHSKCEVSEFQTGKKKLKEEVVVRNKTSDIGDKQIVICGQLRDTYFSFIGALPLMNCNSYCITAEEK